MKQETLNHTNEQINRYVKEARVLRSQAVFRLTGELFKLPTRLLNRSLTMKFSAEKDTGQNS